MLASFCTARSCHCRSHRSPSDLWGVQNEVAESRQYGYERAELEELSKGQLRDILFLHGVPVGKRIKGRMIDRILVSLSPLAQHVRRSLPWLPSVR